MPSEEGVVVRVIASVKALLPKDWRAKAGRIFRAGTQAVSDFATENRIKPKDLLEEGVELGRVKLTGLASQEHAAAERNYAEAAKAFSESEETKINAALKERTLEPDVIKKEAEARKALAEARKANADADLTETQALAARLALLKQLEEAGMVLYRDSCGNLTILPKPTKDPPQLLL